MENSLAFCSVAQQLTRQLFKIYLEDRDFSAMKAMLHSQVTWVGSGKHELCHCYADAVRLLDAERDSWDGHFRIKDYWQKALSLGEDCCQVFGEMNIVEDGLSTILLDMDSRFSLLWKLEDGQPKLYHGHFSVPNAGQREGEFVHKQLVHNYNTILEETLLERTRMLKEKTRELEAITNNIMGGVQICRFQPNFPILYASEGFYRLCGYTPQEVETLLGGNHLPLVYENDLPVLTQVAQQLQLGNSFSMEYRIRHKDGRLIWVVDKGTLLPGPDGSHNVQCILTDITAQKEQEAALRLSEKRYITALHLTEATIFEYDIVKNQLLLFDDVADMYGVPNVVENGMETFIRIGIIEPGSEAAYRAMYAKIFAGEPFAQCFIKTRDREGAVHDYQLSAATIYDSDNRPVRAVGIRKNATQMLQLQKEQAYGETLVSGKCLVCEADITANQVLTLEDAVCQELGLICDGSLAFSGMVEALAQQKIYEGCRQDFRQQLSIPHIAKQFHQGNNSFAFYYQWLCKEQGYRWHKCTVNTIREQRTGSLQIRIYHRDVHDLKLKEQRAQEEQLLYETMVAKAMVAYEVNLSRNLVIKGHEHWVSTYGIPLTDNYGEMLLSFANHSTYPQDGPILADALDREWLLACFSKGERHMSCDYRRLSPPADYRWMRCTTHMYEDPRNSDVKGFIYVEDIDEEKQAELTLRYDAQHDLMTGLFNQSTTQSLIEEFLGTSKASCYRHALLVVDIDFFKTVNDTFGHLFGDKVLSDVAAKLRSIFREYDIIGRIGGDEFCVLMKNLPDSVTVGNKAQEVCDQLCCTYAQDKKTVGISASVGVVLYPQHGSHYRDLFHKADEALYTAKRNGRNQYWLP